MRRARMMPPTALYLALTSGLVSAEPIGPDETPTGSPPGDRREHPLHRPLSADGRLGDLIGHPAFAGFAPLLLPWDDRSYDPGMSIREIGTLLPYHSRVESRVVLAALNRMIDDAAAGRQIFYDFYSVAEKRADPSKANTGLFFFRGKPGAPFAVISPGGGFAYVGSVHEGFPYAVDVNAHGLHAFVLRYRVGQGGGPAVRDLAAAVGWIFRHAAELGVGTDGWSAWGSSAGARMAASIGSHGTVAFGGDALPKPATVVMAYTGHSDVAAEEPPTFVVVGERDGIAPPSSMRRRIEALRGLGTPVEFDEYPWIGHGFGTGVGTSAEGWTAAAVAFWKKSIGYGR